MQLPFGWTVDTLTDIVQFGGVGLMALGVGINYDLTGAIAVFALGLPILTIQRHMREQKHLNLLTLQAIQAMHMRFEAQTMGDKLTLEMVRDLHKLLKVIAEEGITRD
jgi:hypothetical protein